MVDCRLHIHPLENVKEYFGKVLARRKWVNKCYKLARMVGHWKNKVPKRLEKPTKRLVPLALKLESAVCLMKQTPYSLNLWEPWESIFINNEGPYSHGSTLARKSFKKRMRLELLQREQPKTGLDEKQTCWTCVLQEIKCKVEDLFQGRVRPRKDLPLTIWKVMLRSTIRLMSGTSGRRSWLV